MQEIKKKRIFIALNLPNNTKNEISSLINNLEIKNKGIKWTQKENLHLTLHFLGYLNNEQIEKVEQIINSLATQFKEMEFSIKEINAFPNLHQPRVIVLSGQQTNGTTVFDLQREIGEKLKESGFIVENRAWKLHLTLGRVKSYNYKFEIPEDLKVKINNFKISSFELMESELMLEGPIYKVVKSYKL
ncbi:MAG: RNA 2',3'-cyclic phosphodiesterase [Patescibacteria group bacterium]